MVVRTTTLCTSLLVFDSISGPEPRFQNSSGKHHIRLVWEHGGYVGAGLFSGIVREGKRFERGLVGRGTAQQSGA